MVKKKKRPSAIQEGKVIGGIQGEKLDRQQRPQVEGERLTGAGSLTTSFKQGIAQVTDEKGNVVTDQGQGIHTKQTGQGARVEVAGGVSTAPPQAAEIESIARNIVAQGGEPTEENIKASLGTRFALGALDAPIVGSTIKTISRGLSSLLGKGEEHKALAGDLTGMDIAETALTIGTLGVGAGYLAGKLATKGAYTGISAGGRAIISRTATIKTSSQIGFKAPLVTERAFAGKAAKTGVNKIFSAARPVAARFATNAKSTALTKGFLLKLGLGFAGVDLALKAIGTYPFAAFGKEEALQAINFPIYKLIDLGKFDEAQNLLNESNTLIEKIPSKIPYKNTLESFNNFAKAQAEANKGWQTIIDTERTKMKGGI